MLLVAEPSTTNTSPTEVNVDEHCCNGGGVHPVEGGLCQRLTT